MRLNPRRADVLLLFENLPHEPHVTERVDDGALEHPADRSRSTRGVSVFPDRALLDRSGSYASLVYGDGVVHEEFDPHRRETHEAGPRVP
jgi:hypothetical protein